MIKKLTAIGNSHGLVIDKSILELLKIAPDTELELSTDGIRLIIEPRTSKRSRVTPALSPARPPRPPRPDSRYGFPKKQPW